MNIQISSKKISLNDATRAYIERRVLFSMGRLLKRVEEVKIRLSRLNNSKGSGDKICQIRVQLKKEGTVLIEDSDTDLYRLIHRTVERAGFAVSKAMNRSRKFEHTPARALSSEFAGNIAFANHSTESPVAP